MSTRPACWLFRALRWVQSLLLGCLQGAMWWYDGCQERRCTGKYMPLYIASTPGCLGATSYELQYVFMAASAINHECKLEEVRVARAV